MVTELDTSTEYTLKQKNKTYYNFLVNEEKHHPHTVAKEKVKEKKRSKQKSSFGQQKIQLSDLPIAPKGYESIAYFLYTLLLPYGVGYLFLISVLKGATSTNSIFTNSDNFLIVWIVGYEVLSVLALLWIFKLFFNFGNSKMA